MRGRVKAILSALLILSLMVATSCATPGKSVGAGATAGGIVGAGVGALADPGDHGQNRFRNVVIGTAAGTVIGAGAGFAMDRYVEGERQAAAQGEKEEATRTAAAHAATSAGMAPRLIPARTEARWVPDQVRGSTFIPGHFEYVIVQGARWETGK